MSKCPNKSCQHNISHIHITYPPDGKRMMKSLAGLNITRRIRVCEKCGERFSTIEMLESEFDKLRKPVTLQQPINQARKI